MSENRCEPQAEGLDGHLHPNGGSTGGRRLGEGGSPQGPVLHFPAPTTLPVSPLHAQIIEDLWWATEQQARGLLPGQPGDYLAVCEKAVLGSGPFVNVLLDEVTRAHPTIPRERIALYYVGSPD